ncbi:unnamed protein product [Pleuronectes platessa]|uniref:Uncharacterized protein n=1 Tax=Pleuronectes platessa TaxID=8262 RepID=A0A9N7UC50_PLEPL|nr:unnamed protein product [Pleuronectes platessa]
MVTDGDVALPEKRNKARGRIGRGQEGARKEGKAEDEWRKEEWKKKESQGKGRRADRQKRDGTDVGELWQREAANREVPTGSWKHR